MEHKKFKWSLDKVINYLSKVLIFILYQQIQIIKVTLIYLQYHHSKKLER